MALGREEDAKRGVRPWAIKPERQSWHRKRRVGEGEVEERKTKMSKEHPGRFYAVVVMISKYQKPPKLQRSIVSGLKGDLGCWGVDRVRVLALRVRAFEIRTQISMKRKKVKRRKGGYAIVKQECQFWSGIVGNRDALSWQSEQEQVRGVVSHSWNMSIEVQSSSIAPSA